MSSYGINLTINAEGLQYIYSNDLYVTVVRDAQANRPAGDLPVAWLAFQPLENNQITWGESYYLYATPPWRAVRSSR